MLARQTRPRLRSTLEQARRRFERWRRIRPHLLPIPEALWALAVEGAREHGASRTARLLRLNYDTLKQHLRAADGSAALGPQSSTTFLELAPPRPAESFPCTLELEKAQAKMKIHLANAGSVDLVELSRSFWSAGS